MNFTHHHNNHHNDNHNHNDNHHNHNHHKKTCCCHDYPGHFTSVDCNTTKLNTCKHVFGMKNKIQFNYNDYDNYKKIYDNKNYDKKYNNKCNCR